MNPRSSLRQLAKSFIHISGGNGLGLLLSLATFPLLTRFLSKQEYGLLGLATALFYAMLAVAKMGTSETMIRFSPGVSADRERYRSLISTISVGIIFSSIVTAIACISFTVAFAPHLGMAPELTACVLICAAVAFRPYSVFATNVLRARGNSFSYSAISFGMRALSAALGLGLLLLGPPRLTHYSLGLLAADVIAASALFAWLFKTGLVRTSFASWKIAREIAAFGLPFMLFEFGGHILEYVDRFILAAFQSQAEVASYSVAASIPRYVGEILVQAMALSIVPIYSNLHAKHGRAATTEFLGRAFRLYVGVAMLVWASYMILSRDITILLASERYAESASISPLLLASQLLMGLNPLVFAGLYLQSRSTRLFTPLIGAAVVNVVLSLLLVPRYAAFGAACAHALGYLTLVASSATMAFRYLPFRTLQWGLGIYLIGAAAIVVFGSTVHLQSSWLDVLSRMGVALVVSVVTIFVMERSSLAQIRETLQHPDG